MILIVVGVVVVVVAGVIGFICWWRWPILMAHTYKRDPYIRWKKYLFHGIPQRDPQTKPAKYGKIYRGDPKAAWQCEKAMERFAMGLDMPEDYNLEAYEREVQVVRTAPGTTRPRCLDFDQWTSDMVDSRTKGEEIRV